MAGAIQSSPPLRVTPNAASSDQHGDAVHGVAAIALRIPEAGLMRLHRAFGIGGARPDFEIAVGRQFDGGGPALPVILVLWLFKFGALPGGAEIGRDIHLLDGEVAGPGGAAQFQFLGAGGELRAVGGIGDDGAHRHRFQDAEIRRIGLAPGTIGLIAVR